MCTERVRSDYYSLLKRKMLLAVVIICQKKTTFISDTHLSVNRIQIVSAPVSYSTVIIKRAYWYSSFSLKSILAIWPGMSYLTVVSFRMCFTMTTLCLPLLLNHALSITFLGYEHFDWSSIFLWGSVWTISLWATLLKYNRTVVEKTCSMSDNRCRIMCAVNPPPSFSLFLVSVISLALSYCTYCIWWLLLIKSDWAFYGCVNPRKMHVFAHKAHAILSCVCVLSIWISCATDVALLVWSIHHQQSSVLALRAQSLVISSAMNKWGCFKIRNIYMRWLTMSVLMFCLCCIFMQITIIFIH